MVPGHVWLLKAGSLVNCCSRGASGCGYAEGDMIWKHSRALGVWSTAALSAPPAVYVAASAFSSGFIASLPFNLSSLSSPSTDVNL